MIKITYELTGLMDVGILEDVIAKATESIKAKLTDDEQNQIRIVVKGGSLDDLLACSPKVDPDAMRV
jgi:hypothetical protein